MPRVFISAAAADHERIEHTLVPLLREHGIETWVRPGELDGQPGRQHKVLRALETYDWILIALTPAALESPWVRAEVEWAMRERRERVAPVLLETCKYEALAPAWTKAPPLDFRGASASAGRALVRALLGERDQSAGQSSLIESLRQALRTTVTIDEPRSPFFDPDLLPAYWGRTTSTNDLVRVRVAGRGRLVSADATGAEIRKARVDHPDVANPIESGELPGALFWVTAFPPGRFSESLADDMRSARPRTIDQMASIVSAVGRVLQAAHDQGILHLGLSPDSVFADARWIGRYVVTDFALSRALGLRLKEQGYRFDPARLVHISRGRYASPELHEAQAERIGPASDQYSLACIAFHLLVGSPPFTGDTIEEQARAHAAGLSPFYADDIPVDVSSAIARAMSPDPAMRFSSVAEFVDAFSEWASPISERLSNRLVRFLPNRYRLQSHSWDRSDMVGATLDDTATGSAVSATAADPWRVEPAVFLAEMERFTAVTIDGARLPLDFGVGPGLFFYTEATRRGTQNAHTRMRENGPLSIGEAVALIARIAEVLQRAHAQGIVHLAMRTAAILLDDGSPSLAGWGDSRLWGVSRLDLDRWTQGDRHYKGYSSPEMSVMNGTPVDARADQFSLARIFQELVSGTEPTGEAEPDVSRLPPTIRSVLTRGTAHDPADRYPDVGEFASALVEGWRLSVVERSGIRTLPRYRDHDVVYDAHPHALLTATDVEQDRAVYLIVYDSTVDAQRTEPGAFALEMSALSQVVSPMLRTPSDWGSLDDYLFYAEPRESAEERRLVSPGLGSGMSAAEAVTTIVGVAAALTRLHAAGLGHFSLIPETILLRANDPSSVAISRLGHARLWGVRRTSDGGWNNGARSYSGFSSPEQRGGGSTFGLLTDQFALAQVFRSCVAGAAVTVDGAVATADAALPDEVREVVERASQSDPAARYESVEAFARALELAVGRPPTPGEPAAIARFRSVAPSRYRLDEVVAEADVLEFQAHDELRDEAVRIVVYAPTTMDNARPPAEFRADMRRITRLRHANIEPTLDFGIVDGLYYYVTPPRDGLPLFKDPDWILSRAPVLDMLALTRQIGAALDHAHASGVIHGSVSGWTITRRDDDITLTDFGRTRFATGAPGFHDLVRTFIAPEVRAPDCAPDHRCDQWGLAYVFGFGAGIIAPGLSTDEHDDEADRTTEVGRVLERAASSDASYRYNSIEAFVSALETAAERDRAQDAKLARLQPALPIGAIVRDQYRIDEIIGRRGGAGLTYLAHDLSLDKPFALKELLPTGIVVRSHDTTLRARDDDATFAELKERFLRTARLLARVDHPAVVRVVTSFATNGTAYLVTDLVAGDSLARRLDGGARIETVGAIRIALGILDGLAALHEKRILHCGVEPATVLLDAGQNPILLHANSIQVVEAMRSDASAHEYAAPEQTGAFGQHGSVGPWTDIYACAATLYHMVTGTPPTAAIERLADDTLLPPQFLVPTITAELSDAIMNALRCDVASRTSSTQAFRQALMSTRAPSTFSNVMDTGDVARNAAGRPRCVFISHSSKDRSVVERDIMGPLRRHGVEMWYSRDDIESADLWQDRIVSGLETCDWLIVVVSANSIGSPWVRAEVDWALENRRGRVIPVFIENCPVDKLNIQLRLVQRVELHGGKHEAILGLLRKWGFSIVDEPTGSR